MLIVGVKDIVWNQTIKWGVEKEFFYNGKGRMRGTYWHASIHDTATAKLYQISALNCCQNTKKYFDSLQSR